MNAGKEGRQVPPLRVVMVGKSATDGGAARALARINHSLNAEWPSDRWTASLRAADRRPLQGDGVAGLPGGSSRLARQASWRVSELRRIVHREANREFLHSKADVWTGLGRELSNSSFDVVNLHWLGTGTLSIEEVGRLRKPIVWTLHDMWPFSGAEHYSLGTGYQDGYVDRATPADVENRAVWLRKKRHWRAPHHVVAPSRWLAECVQSSALMKDWPVRVIPNPLDFSIWSPGSQADARQKLGFNRDAKLVMFAASGGTRNSAKGFSLLDDALRRISHVNANGLSGQSHGLILVGDPKRRPVTVPGWQTHNVGEVVDNATIVDLYRAADVVVVPSRIEAFGQVASEAQACGTPVVAFKLGGLQDIVDDFVTGRLVDPFDTQMLAGVIEWVLQSDDRRVALGRGASVRMRERFNSQVVAEGYLQVFHDAIGMSQRDQGGKRRR